MHNFCLLYSALSKDILSKLFSCIWLEVYWATPRICSETICNFILLWKTFELPPTLMIQIKTYHIKPKQTSLLNRSIMQKHHWGFHKTEEASWFYKKKRLFWSLASMELVSLHLWPRSGLFLIIIINFYRPACLQQQQLFL